MKKVLLGCGVLLALGLVTCGGGCLVFRAWDHASVAAMVADRTKCPLDQVKVVSSTSGFLDAQYEVEACGRHLTIRCAGNDMECGGF